jgi:hypothetical protein
MKADDGWVGASCASTGDASLNLSPPPPLSVGEWEPYGLSSRKLEILWRHPTGYVRASLGRSFTSND